METTSLIFAQPQWFYAMVLLPIVAGIHFWARKRSESLIAKVVAPRLRQQLAGAVSPGRRILKTVLILLTFACIVTALARPQMGFIQREIKQRGRDIIIAVDTSRSMLATDVTPTRLARAKLVAQDLLALLRGDRIGLVAFAGSAFLQAPLTVDYTAVLGALDALDTTVIPKGGSDIAAAIETAEEAFGKGEGKTRALIILTDGEELSADAVAAAKKAGELGVRIFTVGIGSAEGSLIPLPTAGAGADFVRDSAGKPVQSRLDENRLKEIAAAGEGFYLPMSTDVAREIFEKGILPIETSETGVLSSKLPIERYQWPVGAGILFLALWMLLGDRRRVPTAIRRATVALFVISAAAAQGKTGVEEYQAGDYAGAMSQFQQNLQEAPNSTKRQFNAGAAAYQLGDYAKAVDYFTKALVSDSSQLHEDAAYNLGNALARRGEAAQGNEEKKADWNNAIQHYTEALSSDPKNKNAEENREIVKKLLKDLEKQEEEQKKDDEKKDDEKKDDEKKDDEKKDDEKKDDEKKGDEKKGDEKKGDEKKDDEKKGDEKKGDEKKGDEKKDDEKKGDEKKDDEKKDDEKKDDEKKDDEKKGEDQGQKQDQDEKQDQKQNAAPQPTPGEKKEGDLKPAQGEPQAPKEGEGAPAEPVEKEGEMTEAQAKRLLNSLRGEEGQVQLMKSSETEDSLRDW